MKTIIASGAVVLNEGKVLLIKDRKDPFYKIPGGTVKEGEDLERTCIREFEEETRGKIDIIKPLSPMVLYKNPKTKEEMTLVLIHYLARLSNPKQLAPGKGIEKVEWINVLDLKRERYEIAPNIEYLIKKGEIR